MRPRSSAGGLALAVTTAALVAAMGLVLPGRLGVGAPSLAAALAQAAAGMFMLRRGRRCPSDDSLRWTWLWLGISAISGAAVFLLWGVSALASGSLPAVPSAADAFYLAAVVTEVVALAGLLPRRSDGGWPVRWVLDSMLVAVALFVVSWEVVLERGFDQQRDSALAAGLLVSYPLFDIMAITLGTIVALRVRRRLQGLVGWIVAGIAALAMGDLLYTYLSLSARAGRFALPAAMALWTCGYWLAAVPLLARTSPRGVADDPDNVRSTSVIPNVAAGGALLVALVSQPDPVVVIAGGLLCVLVLSRQTLAVRAESSANARLEETVRERTEALRHLAFHDSLTGLVKREVLVDRLGHIFARRPSDRQPVSLLVLDVDGFKAVNDSYGHGFGDGVLAAAARRIQAVLRPSDTAARMGGDEFAVLLDGVDAAGAIAAAQRILGGFREPVPLDSHSVVVNVSVGVTVSPGGEDADLMAQADVAMYAAKAGGKGQYRMFDAEMHDATLARLRLGAELGVAIGEGGIEAHYQPIVNLATGTVVGFEALARWQDRSGRFVPPVDFIPLAEESGLILELGQSVLEKACAQLALWQRRFPKADPLTMSVNLSPRQFNHPELVALFCRTVEAARVAFGSVRLELTESAVIDTPEMIAKLHELTAAGFRLSIDDFGTGYSSFSYLRRLPVDTVKIDRSLVTGVATEAEEWAMLRGIIKLVHGLGLSTIAEGVELPEQMVHLRSLGCQYAQGYYFWRPLTADRAGEVLAGQAPALVVS